MTTAETIDDTEAAEEELVKFTESDQCKSFRFCKSCRDTGSVGKLWRRVVAKRFIVPSEDWKCPHGWKWGGEPGLILKLKRKFKPGTRFGRTTSAVGIKPCGGCARRAAKMDGRQA